MSKSLVEFIAFLIIAFACHSTLFAAEAKRPPEWDRIVEAAKKEGKIVIAIPPAAELRKEMEIVIRQKLGLEAELVPNPGPGSGREVCGDHYQIISSRKNTINFSRRRS